MRILITGKNIEVSDYLRELVNKKVSKLERYFPNDTVAQVTIPYSGVIIRGVEVTGDMYASIDNVLDKLEKQIIKHRTRLEKNLRAGAFKPEEGFMADITEDADDEPAHLVRVKRFDMKPMTVEEAMLQLQLLGHAFYVFSNADTDDINVIYLRKDGNFGLIEPA